MSFNSMRISKKIAVGFGILLVLLLFISVVGYFALKDSSTGIERYRAIARNTNTIGRIQANLLMMRMKVKDFLMTSDDKDADEFNEYYKKTTLFIDEAASAINNPDRKGKVLNIKGQLKDYGDGFNKVLEFQRTRNDGVHSGINAIGPKIEKDILNILTTARRDNDMQAAYNASLAMRNLVLARLYVLKYLDENKLSHVDRVDSEFREMKVNLDTLDKELQNRERRRYLASVIEGVEKYKLQFVKVVDSIKGRNKIVAEKLNVIGKDIADITEEIKLQYKQEQDTLGPQIVEKNNTSMNFTLIAAIIALLGGIVFSFKISKSIVTPLMDMVKSTYDLSQGDGDLTKRLEINTTDEVGELAENFNLFVEKLQGSISQVAFTTRELGDTSVDLAEKSENLATSVEEMSSQSGNVASAAEEITVNVANVTAATENMSENASSIASATEEMSSSVNSIATAIEELTSSLQEVSKNTVRAASIASDAADNANTTTNIMHHLEEASQSIGKVLDVISDIADQTNLLALNATIEAASAGEAGKGFAVVANEVKELAKQTAQATEEISVQISDMQKRTGESVGAIRKVTDIIGEINEITSTIASAVEEQTATTNEISRSIIGASEGVNEMSSNIQNLNVNIQENVLRGTKEASTGVGEVSRNIQDVNSVAQDTAKVVSDTNVVAQNINGLAQKLQEVVSQFKI